MATKIKRIEKGVWEMIANVEVDFQVTVGNDLHICEAASTPTKTTVYKVAEARQIYNFKPTGGSKLFGYSPDETITVAYDEVQ
jgi:hypothetical protein